MKLRWFYTLPPSFFVLLKMSYFFVKKKHTFLLKMSCLIFSTLIFYFGNVQTCKKVERKGDKSFWTRHSASTTDIFASCASSNFSLTKPHPSLPPTCTLCFLDYFNENPKFIISLARYLSQHLIL